MGGQGTARTCQHANPLVATLEVLPCRGGENFLYEVFQPLGTRSRPSVIRWTNSLTSGAKVPITR